MSLGEEVGYRPRQWGWGQTAPSNRRRAKGGPWQRVELDGLVMGEGLDKVPSNGAGR